MDEKIRLIIASAVSFVAGFGIGYICKKSGKEADEKVINFDEGERIIRPEDYSSGEGTRISLSDVIAESYEGLEEPSDELGDICNYINGELISNENFDSDEEREEFVTNTLSFEPIVVVDQDENYSPDYINVNETVEDGGDDEEVIIAPYEISNAAYSEVIPNFEKAEVEYSVKDDRFFIKGYYDPLSPRLAEGLFGHDVVNKIKDPAYKNDFIWVRNERYSHDYEIFIDRISSYK